MDIEKKPRLPGVDASRGREKASDSASSEREAVTMLERIGPRGACSAGRIRSRWGRRLTP